MTSITISHDRHTTTSWELQDDGTIYVSSAGDGEAVSPGEAFRQLAEALERNPLLVSAETQLPASSASE